MRPCRRDRHDIGEHIFPPTQHHTVGIQAEHSNHPPLIQRCPDLILRHLPLIVVVYQRRRILRKSLLIQRSREQLLRSLQPSYLHLSYLFRLLSTPEVPPQPGAPHRFAQALPALSSTVPLPRDFVPQELLFPIAQTPTDASVRRGIICRIRASSAVAPDIFAHSCWDSS